MTLASDNLTPLHRRKEGDFVAVREDIGCVLIIHADSHQGRFLHRGEFWEPLFQLLVEFAESCSGRDSFGDARTAGQVLEPGVKANGHLHLKNLKSKVQSLNPS